MIDNAVKKGLQKARRNVNLLQKMGRGIYSIKGKNQVVIVQMTEDNTFTATFRPQKSHTTDTQTVELSQFISHI